jgi:aspartate kinase
MIRLIKQHVKPQRGKLIIIQGFIASTQDDITTTLGRGGSDYTATIIGAALDAEEVQIWSDVSGIMTSDPRMVKKALTIPQISYKEAAELAYFGARVIHPSTIQPAIDKKITVIIKNTGQPQDPGTSIVPDIPERGLKAIASKVDITLINVTSSRMLLAYGFLRSIFHIFDKYKTSVDLVSTSEVSVSMTIDNPVMLDMIKADLENIGIVSIEPSMSIICLVGQELWKDSHFITRVFRVLKSIPIRMISLGSSDTNLSLVVSSAHADDTVKRLHQEFFD